MLLIELTFLNGRFHATPWGRNVNEGVPEWPPSPYRLLRAIYDTWKRKRPDWPETRVEPLLEALASDLPRFSLPYARTSHTRSFLSQNLKEVTKRQLIFDAFILMDRGSKVTIGWPNIDLEEGKQKDMAELLSLINYLGRSESWVSARINPETIEPSWNCIPANCSEDARGEEVQVACPISAQEYSAKPYVIHGISRKSKPRTLGWMEALSLSTAEMLEHRQNEPPAFRFIAYVRAANCFSLRTTSHMQARRPVINGVLYALESKVPARVTSTIEVSERFRRKLMGIHKRITGDPKRLSQKFSGKDSEGRPLTGHRHIYVIPMDRDKDGLLDHLLAVCREPLDLEEQLSLDRLNSIWQPDGKPDIQLVPIQWGKIGELEGTEPRTSFISATPFMPLRHYRKGRGDFTNWLFQEVRKEAANQGLPEPAEIKLVPTLACSGRDIRWLEFRRSRKGESSQVGYGFSLVFPDPVSGPVAMGYGAHFGLGYFVAESP